MLIKRISSTLLITGAIAISPTVTHAQSTGTEFQTATQESHADDHRKGAQKNAIVGTWVGTLSDGNRVVISFTSDGIVLGTVTTEVSLDPRIPSLTAPQGVWKHLGGRRFAITSIGLLYDLPPVGLGTYQGRLKIRSVLTIDRFGNQLSGTDKVEVFGPDEQLLETFPEGTAEYTRMQVEPLN